MKKKKCLTRMYFIFLVVFIFLETLSVSAQIISRDNISFFKKGENKITPHTETGYLSTRTNAQFGFTGSWRAISEIGIYEGEAIINDVFQEGECMIWFNEDGTYVISNYRDNEIFQRRWWYINDNTFGDSDGFVVSLVSYKDGIFIGRVENIDQPGYLTTLTMKRDNKVSMSIGKGFGYLKDKETKYIVGASADGETRLRTLITTIVDDFSKYKVVFFSQYGEDETVCGAISDFKKTGKSTASFIYTVPKVYPSIEGRTYTVKLRLNLYDANGDLLTYGELPIRIIRPPVLLIHGLGDDASCFASFKEYLYLSSANYFGFQLHLADYSNTNKSPFVDNMYVVQNCFKELFQTCYERGYVASKADIIGHSMGGLLAREYIQDVSQNGVYKLITLNTPHFGSQGANLIIKDIYPFYFAQLASLNFEGQFGAIRDLQVNSNAFTSHLNTLSGLSRLKGIPIHTVCTEFSSNGSLGEVAVENAIALIIRGYVKLWRKENMNSISLDHLLELIYNGPSDLVVPSSSQTGGLSDSNVSILSDNTIGTIHMFTPKDPTIHELLRGLLAKSPESSLFTKQGLILKPEKELTTEDMKKIYDYMVTPDLSTLEITKSTSSQIRINEYALDDSRHLNVKCDISSDVEAHVVFVLMDNASYMKDELSFREPVDSDYEGTISICAMARTASGEFIGDIAKVRVNRIINESQYQYASFEGGDEIDTLLFFKGKFSSPLMELYRTDGKVELVLPDRYELPDWTDIPNNSVEIRDDRVYGVSEGSGWIVGSISSLNASIPYKVINPVSIELADDMDTAINMPIINNADKKHFVNFTFLPTKKVALLSFVKADMSSVLIEIYDISSRLHRSFTQTFENELFINLDFLPSGTYVIRISEKSSNESFKFIVP